ncbi:MAG TPA: hypothetical protein PK926_00505 [Spirochaetota bacterium]|nr:hypothetical protein [Spirochaetota bacterium]HPI87831.1 hypothetical protein [Spirochaetota bacterium]HPR47437.1 hypothetical protein [Spirochaetota bacterium]
MREGRIKDYLNISLHLITALIALAALTLGLVNYRAINNLQREVSGIVQESLKEKEVKEADLEGSSASLQKKTINKKKVRSGKSRVKKKNIRPVAASKKSGSTINRKREDAEPVQDEPPGAERGLDQIITDLVDSVIKK